MMLLYPFLGMLLIGGSLVSLLGNRELVLHERGGEGGRSSQRAAPTAREMLDWRLARGEISSEEYEAIRHQIES